MTSDNGASALYSILSQVRSSSRDTVGRAWGEVLGCDVGTKEFAQRHSEVVGLFHRVSTFVESMPEGPQRENNLRYLPAWHAGVVHRGHWDSQQNPPRNVISQSNLDQLGGVMEALSNATSSRLTDESISALRRALDEWKKLLAQSDLPSDTREQIRSHVQHIEWLLENLQLFGSEPVIRETRNLIGIGIEAIQKLPAAAKQVGVALTLVVWVLSMVNEGVEHVGGILEGMHEVVDQIEAFDPEAVNAESLEGADSGDVIDAEFEEVDPEQ